MAIERINDEYRVIIGSEDSYAAIQMVLEGNGDSVPEGWPDYRYF